jgi:predicted aspartyl protease
VDTGATITSLSKVALRRLGASREDANVRLQTASGIIDADLYRVAALEIEGRLFENLRVVELPIEISGVDGLLGVDILDQLPWSVESNR